VAAAVSRFMGRVVKRLAVDRCRTRDAKRGGLERGVGSGGENEGSLFLTRADAGGAENAHAIRQTDHLEADLAVEAGEALRGHHERDAAAAADSEAVRGEREAEVGGGEGKMEAVSVARAAALLQVGDPRDIVAGLRRGELQPRVFAGGIVIHRQLLARPVRNREQRV
jgi:hypothetical protein